MTDDDPENELGWEPTNTGVITITRAAYDAMHDQARLEERLAIIAYLRSSRQPMAHTAWALARDIEHGEHLK